jgi:glycosyltransferase involved in cell wall biosynthesis
VNILILNGGRGWGGIESHTVTLASALAVRGHKVIVGCPRRGCVMKNAAEAGLSARDIEVVNSADIFALLKIISLASEENIEVIIANLGKEYWPAAVAALVLGIKVIFVRHQTDGLKSITRRLIRRHVDRVAAVSIAVKDALVESGVPETKIGVIYNAVDLKRFDPSAVDRPGAKREIGLGPGDVVVGTAGKLETGKGVFELVRAAALLSKTRPSVKLLFVGDGPEKARLIKEAERLSMRDRVIFAGLRSDMEKMYAAMDIFALPSTCTEAFGMVIIEAMAMGRPVVATEIGGIPEIVKNGSNGLLVKPGDHVALAGALGRLMDDAGLSSCLSREGRSAVEQYYSVNAIGLAFEGMLQQVFATS